MKSLLISLKLLLALTILTGIIYPLLIWSYSRVFIPYKSDGSFLYKKNKIIGSELISQKFTKMNYFWSRPSSIDYNPLSSGASQLGPTSTLLKKQVADRINLLSSTHNNNITPNDLIFASASGLDPHISLDSANYQIQRVANENKINIITLQQIVEKLTEKPQYGILGEPRINVLKLNLEIDKLNSN